MKAILSAFWISVYLMLVLAPLLTLVLSKIPPGSSRSWAPDLQAADLCALFFY